MEIVWQCEIDEFCQRILRKHWPTTLLYPDVGHVDWGAPQVDLVAGGFPCPVVSQAARGRNVAKSLWPEFARVIRDLRPRYVLVENVEGLLSKGRGFDRILADLAESGFDAVWRVCRASEAGAPHHRPRVWLVGYPNGDREPDLSFDAEVAGVPELRRPLREWPDPPRDLGVADGLPYRVDRRSRLGNAVVPQIAEWLGRRILESGQQNAQPQP